MVNFHSSITNCETSLVLALDAFQELLRALSHEASEANRLNDFDRAIEVSTAARRIQVLTERFGKIVVEYRYELSEIIKVGPFEREAVDMVDYRPAMDIKDKIVNIAPEVSDHPRYGDEDFRRDPGIDLTSRSADQANLPERGTFTFDNGVKFEGYKVEIKSAHVHAEGLLNGSRLLLLPGSKIRKVSQSSMPELAEQARQYALANKRIEPMGSYHYACIEPISFDTPSAAASFVSGISANGWRDWVLSGTTIPINDALRRKTQRSL